ncbi:MAG: hypothetical protein U1D97_06735 [Desulfuromonadales bacterium]|nr:hypothetical protein [Desulfuromonadales bacterium]
MDSGGDQTGPGTGISDAEKVGSSSCKVCHTTVAIGQLFNSSVHDTAATGCEGCHGGGQFHKGVGPIPFPSPTVVQCAQCHETTSPGFLARHSGDDPATDHTNTSVIEGYVFTSCEECHAPKDPATLQWAHNPAAAAIHQQWGNSAHAGRIASDTPDTAQVWGHYNWDQTTGTGNRAGCQRCHTATGAKNFLNSPTTYTPANNDFSHLSDWTAATGSSQNELLYCSSCHSDVATGVLRNPGAITEVYAAATAGNTAGTATFAYPNLEASNLCMGCHLGREIGDNIKNDNDADGVRGFINSHYLAAGGMIFNVSGYEYAATGYDTLGVHKQVGQADAFGTGTNGPCVTCHMSGPEPHTFTASAASTACASCHGGLTDATLETSKHEFSLALVELKTVLESKGIYFYEAHPYFYTAPYVVGGTNTGFTNWAGVYGLDSWKDVMGAAFNYNLVKHDPGAFVHNRQYALNSSRTPLTS